MKVWIVAVGRPSRLLAGGIAEYERRASRYWNLEVLEVREHRRGRGREEAQVRDVESRRLLERVPHGAEAVALTRTGEAWSSESLAAYLRDLAVHGRAGAAFLVGGAEGVTDAVLHRADHRLAVSAMTLPHELARLILAEQLYRAGTISRGEPYHRAR